MNYIKKFTILYNLFLKKKLSVFGKTYKWFCIDVTYDGIFICSNNAHPLNIPNLIDVTDGEIVILINDLQPENALFPINLTDDGILICFNNMYPDKE